MRLTDDIERLKSYLDQPNARVALCSTKFSYTNEVIARLAQVMPQPKRILQKAYIEWYNGSRLFILCTLRPNAGRGSRLNAAFVVEPSNLDLPDQERHRLFRKTLHILTDNVHFYDV